MRQIVEVTGTTAYAEHSPVFAHFLSGLLLPIFAELAKHDRTPDILILSNTSQKHRKYFKRFMPLLARNISLGPTTSPASRDRLSLDFWNFNSCPFTSRFARYVRERFGIPDRRHRPLTMKLLNRLDPTYPATGGQAKRRILNWGELDAALRKWCGRNRVMYKNSSLKSGVEQIADFADVDILIGMHSSAMTHVMALPPRALVIELQPPAFSYCLVSRCFPHDETIFIKAHTETPERLMHHSQQCKECSVIVPVESFLRDLDVAWNHDVFSGFAMHPSSHACSLGSGTASQTTPLRQWMLQPPRTNRSLWCIDRAPIRNQYGCNNHNRSDDLISGTMRTVLVVSNRTRKFVVDNRPFLLHEHARSAGFGHALNSYLSGVALAHRHSMHLIYQPFSSRGVGFRFEELLWFDGSQLRPPLHVPKLAVVGNQTRPIAKLNGRPLTTFELPLRANPKPKPASAAAVAASLTKAKPSSLMWLRQQFGFDDDAHQLPGAGNRQSLEYAGLWMRERFWSAVLKLRDTAAESSTSPAASPTAGAASLMASPREALVRLSSKLGAMVMPTGDGRRQQTGARGDGRPLLVVHIRRGDVAKHERYRNSHRFVSVPLYVAALQALRVAMQLPLESGAVRVHILTEGTLTQDEMGALVKVAPNAKIHSKGSALDALLLMAQSDILLMGSSGFSWWGGFFSCGLKLGGASGVATLPLPLRKVDGFSFTQGISNPVRAPFRNETQRIKQALAHGVPRLREAWRSYWSCRRQQSCLPSLCAASRVENNATWFQSPLAQDLSSANQWRTLPALDEASLVTSQTMQSVSSQLDASNPNTARRHEAVKLKSSCAAARKTNKWLLSKAQPHSIGGQPKGQEDLVKCVTSEWSAKVQQLTVNLSQARHPIAQSGAV